MGWGSAVILAIVLAGWIATIIVGVQAIDRMRRASERQMQQWSAERRDLIDRVMYMAEKPWMLPPMEQVDEEVEEYVDDAVDTPIPMTEFLDEIDPAGRV